MCAVPSPKRLRAGRDKIQLRVPAEVVVGRFQKRPPLAGRSHTSVDTAKRVATTCPIDFSKTSSPIFRFQGPVGYLSRLAGLVMRFVAHFCGLTFSSLGANCLIVHRKKYSEYLGL